VHLCAHVSFAIAFFLRNVLDTSLPRVVEIHTKIYVCTNCMAFFSTLAYNKYRISTEIIFYMIFVRNQRQNRAQRTSNIYICLTHFLYND